MHHTDHSFETDVEVVRWLAPQVLTEIWRVQVVCHQPNDLATSESVGKVRFSVLPIINIIDKLDTRRLCGISSDACFASVRRS